ncbi:MAG: hypothetical protein ACOVP1_14055 [Bacteroidia bacterium]
MKKILLLVSLVFISLANSQAQRKVKPLDEDLAKEEKKYEDPYGKTLDSDKWKFGGNVTGGLSNGGGMFLLQPLVGYNIKPKTMLGAGFTYIYFQQNYANFKYKSNIYGPQLFVRQTLINNIFLHTEYNPINYPKIIDFRGNTRRDWIHQMFVGGGLNPGQGAYFMVLYDVLYNNQTTFTGTPWDIRVGFFF